MCDVWTIYVLAKVVSIQNNQKIDTKWARMEWNALLCVSCIKEEKRKKKWQQTPKEEWKEQNINVIWQQLVFEFNVNYGIYIRYCKH